MTRVAVGDVYGRLTVLELVYDRKNPKARCLCICGNETCTQRGALKNGRATSCGCHRREALVAAAKTHGLSKTVEYKVFSGMADRCTNPNNPHYSNYGGRGIKLGYVDFPEFLADVGVRGNGMWIDRIDNNKGYEPGNCRWVSPSDNQKNKRVSKRWEICGKVFESSVDAAKYLGVTPSVVVRGCNGYTRNGKVFAPREGWLSEHKY